MRVKYVDVLKAFAIIAVVLYHTGILTYGYLGVDLFLVIAGYLTTKSLFSKYVIANNIRGGLVLFSFEISRVIRLLPPLLVAGTFCMAVGYFVMLPDDYENLSQSVVATNFFGNNILSAITTKNYWDVVNEYKPLMHTWYVGVLMQFYIVYPLLFLFVKRSNNPKRILLVIISSLAILSLLIYFLTEDVSHRFYYLPSRFFEFATGGIVALLLKSQDEDKKHFVFFIYVCYALLMALMFVNLEVIPAIIKLVVVVLLSCIMLRSKGALENDVTGNVMLAKVGAASYSIFIWHQILLAFCRYTITSEFSTVTYLWLLFATAVLSWGSYCIIEQKTNQMLSSKCCKKILYIAIIVIFFLLTAFAGYIYRQGGVVRDVPELYITKGERVNHKDYNDKIYKLDKPFGSDKLHWLVIGNSFGRDFANLILESEVADSIELTYIYMDDFAKQEKLERYANSDRIFLSSLGTDEELVSKVEAVCIANGFPVEKLVIVGTKNFGESNGQFYVKRNSPDYFEQRTKMEPGYYKNNERMKAHYGNRYMDLIGLVIDEKGTMPVFTPDHHFVSQDCRHFSMGGAKWFATLIDWNKYLN